MTVKYKVSGRTREFGKVLSAMSKTRLKEWGPDSPWNECEFKELKLRVQCCKMKLVVVGHGFRHDNFSGLG